MTPIVLHISAAADPSLKTAADPLLVSFKKARVAVRKEMDGLASDVVRSTSRSTSGASKAYDALEKEFAKHEAAMARSADRAAQQRTRAALREFDERAKASAKARAAEEKDIFAVAKAAERAETQKAKAAERTRAQTVRRFGSEVKNNFGNIVRRGAGIAGGALQGAGVDLDPGSLIKKNIDWQSLATDIANSTAVSQNRKVTQNDLNDVMSTIRGTGDAAKVEYGQAAEALDLFVKRSADLETAKTVMTDLAHLSNATGSSLSDMGAAAGAVDKALEGTPDKARALMDVMTVVAAQGAKGEVEISDLAVNLSKITGMANRIEGGRAGSLAQLGVLTQMSMSGGAQDAATATTSAQRFVTDLTKGANLGKFEEAGIDIFANKGHTKVRKPEDIIADVLQKTNGDIGQLTKLFPNEMSKRVVMGFLNDFNTGGVAGVHKRFREMGGTVDADVLKSASDLKENGPAAKVTEINNKLADAMAQAVPVIVSSLPMIEKGFRKLADLGTWMGENPGAALAAALALSIAKAGIGEAVKNTLTNILGGGGGAPGGAPGAPGGPGVLGTAGAAITIMASSVALYAAGKLFIDEMFKKDSKREDNAILADTTARNIHNQYRATGKFDVDAANKELADLQRRSKNASMYLYGDNNGGADIFKMSADEMQQAKSDSEHMGALSSGINQLTLDRNENFIKQAIGGVAPKAENPAVKSDQPDWESIKASFNLQGDKTAQAIEGLGSKTLNVNATVNNFPANFGNPGVGDGRVE